MKARRLVLRALLVSIFVLAGCKEQIVHNLSESDANRVVTTLAQASIRSAKLKQADGQWSISVDSEQSVEALRYLGDQRLLRDGGEKPLAEASVLGSREDQRFHYERALSQEIGKTLAGIPGVLDARVHLNLPLTDPLFGQPIDSKAGSASVLVVSRDGAVTREDIALLVAGASGVAVKQISVLITKVGARENVAPPILGTNATVGPDNQRARETASQQPLEIGEMDLTAKATENLTWQLSDLVSIRGVLGQIALSLLMLGGWILVRTLRGKRTAKVFQYDT